MPREEYPIQTFDKGLYSAYDQQDIPDGAASWSIEENPESIGGTVQPRLDDIVYFDYPGIAGPHQCTDRFAWITREDNKRDFIYYNANLGNIEDIRDFMSTSGFTGTYDTISSAPGTGKTVTFDTINRAVRMGWGDNNTKYIGYIDHGQYWGSVPSGIQYLDSELTKPFEFPVLYSAFNDATNIYGIEWQGKFIYKINATTGAWTKSKAFTSLQGLCAFDANNFYVFDNVSSGSIIKILKSDLSVSVQTDVNGYDSVGASFITTATHISDIIITRDSTNMFLATYRSEQAFAYSQTPPLIYKIAVASLTNGVSVTPSTFWRGDLTIDNTQLGYLADGNGPGPSGQTEFFPAKKSLSLSADITKTTEFVYLVRISGNIVYDVGALKSYNPYWTYCILDSSLADIHFPPAVPASTKIAMVELKTVANGFVMENATFDIYNTSHYNLIYYDQVKLKLVQHKLDTYGKSIATSNTYADTYLGDPIWVQLDGGLCSETEFTTPTSNTHWLVINENTGSHTWDPIYIFGNSTSEIGCFWTILWTDADSFNTQTFVLRSSFGLSLTEVITPVSTLSKAKQYFYRCAYVYDYYQISPLCTRFFSFAITAEPDCINVAIQLFNTASEPKSRVTSIQVYRAESDTLGATMPDTSYKLVDTVSIERGTGIGQLVGWGTYKWVRLNDIGNYGPTYETETGIPETLPNNTMRYTISAQGAGYLFVGQAFNDEISKVANLVFRSKKNAQDTFDWSNDFCVLPTMPIALQYFKGYLYAFDNSTMYVIEPEALVLVGEYKGFGVQSNLAITVNEAAMYFANQDNVFMHDGKTPSVISYPVNLIGTTVSGATSHRTLQSGRTIQLTISSKYNCLVVAYMKYSSNEASTPMFIYHFEKQMWFYWTSSQPTDGLGQTEISYSTTDKRCIFADYKGNLFLSVNNGLVQIMGSGTAKTATWYSKQVTFGDNNILKKFYMVLFSGSVTTSEYGVDGTTPATSFTSGTYFGSLSTKHSSIQLKFTMADSKILKGITVIFRRMIGLR